MGYSPGGRKGSDTTEQLSTYTHIEIKMVKKKKELKAEKHETWSSFIIIIVEDLLCTLYKVH